MRLTSPPFCAYALYFTFQEICKQWPSVTAAEINDQLNKYFRPSLFTPSDIRDERGKLKELLQECK